MPEINIINSNAALCENGEGPLFIRIGPGTSTIQFLEQLHGAGVRLTRLPANSYIGGIGKTPMMAQIAGVLNGGGAIAVDNPGSNLAQGSTVEWATTADTTSPRELADAGSSKARETFKSGLIAALRAEHIEDGMSHPAEDIIYSAFEASPEIALQWTQSLFTDNYYKKPVIAGAILRLLGRLPYRVVGSTGMLLAIGGLIHQEIQVRDSAVRALESWGDPSSRVVLENHVDREPAPRLAKYIKQVIKDLSS